MELQRRLLISAFGIHVGGGLVLFKSLLQASRDITRKVTLDARVPPDVLVHAAEGGIQIESVPRSFFARLRAMLQIGSEAGLDDILLCFNSLPPLVRSRAKVIVYVQAPHFFGAHAGIRYARTVALRLLIERLWFWYGLRYVDEFWVQTPTMATLLTAMYPAVTVKVLPLVDEKLAELFQTKWPNAVCSGSNKDYSMYDFFYPADAVGHKNHIQLFRAWHILDRLGYRPRLTLTLSQDEFAAVHRLAGFRVGELTQIVNIGRQTRLAVLDRLEESSALMFPSLAETFGLPMLEAASLGVPIIASERDFVRDVCTPQESFDPNSARSIADAVVRFIEGQSVKSLRIYRPDEFVTLLRDSGHAHPVA